MYMDVYDCIRMYINAWDSICCQIRQLCQLHHICHLCQSASTDPDHINVGSRSVSAATFATVTSVNDHACSIVENWWWLRPHCCQCCGDEHSLDQFPPLTTVAVRVSRADSGGCFCVDVDSGNSSIVAASTAGASNGNRGGADR